MVPDPDMGNGFIWAMSITLDFVIEGDIMRMTKYELHNYYIKIKIHIFVMLIKKYKMFLESLKELSPKDILNELGIDLVDAGLYIEFSNDNKFNGNFYMAISDDDKVFCKNYPEDDLDWLFNKPIMMEFYKDLEEFGLKRDKDYKVYGGGTGVNLVFEDEKVVKL